ncbi:MAG: hypothetical protein ACR2NV_05125 [Thermoleophilaceae bacterium]
MSGQILAHETWFEPGSFPVDLGFASEGATVALLGMAVAVTVAIRLAARVRPGIDIPWLARMAPFMPFAIRLHLAVSLLGLLSLGYYLSPAMQLKPNLPGLLLGAVMALVTVGMASGWRTRPAAGLLVAAGPLGMFEFGVVPVLERVDLLGLAVFVLIAGPGRWSADVEQGRAGEPGETALARAVWCLRVAAGGALVFVAFTEKLARPELALAFLANNPELNVAQAVGIDMSNLEFIRMAGTAEVLFGLLLISGALPQVGVVIIGIPFNATLWFFGNVELVGHLPVYGAMLALLVFGSHPTMRPRVSELWPWSRPTATRADRSVAPSPAPGASPAEAR